MPPTRTRCQEGRGYVLSAEEASKPERACLPTNNLGDPHKLSKGVAPAASACFLFRHVALTFVVVTGLKFVSLGSTRAPSKPGRNELFETATAASAGRDECPRRESGRTEPSGGQMWSVRIQAARRSYR